MLGDLLEVLDLSIVVYVTYFGWFVVLLLRM